MSKYGFLTASKVANILDVSVRTLTTWYSYYNNPDMEKPKDMPPLPQYVQEHKQAPRYWKESDVPLLEAFRDWVPRGRKGVMGSLNNKYWSKRGSKNEQSE